MSKRQMKGNTLKTAVQNWLTDESADYETGEQGVLNDLLTHGCISGMVGELVYYSDTCRFYNKHRQEIFALVDEFCNQTGETLGDFLKHANNFPLTKEELSRETFVTGIVGLIRKNKDVADQIKNWFAWFAFEETARQIADEKGYEI